VDGTHHLKLNSNHTGGGGQVSTWPRVIVQGEGAVLQPDKIPVIRHPIPVSGAKIPCSPGKGISRERPAAQRTFAILYYFRTANP